MFNLNHVYKFRRYPKVFTSQLTQFNNEKRNLNIKDVLNSVKIAGFTFGNVLGSFWFGILLFGLQSYFLRQNLGLTNSKYISD